MLSVEIEGRICFLPLLASGCFRQPLSCGGITSTSTSVVTLHPPSPVALSSLCCDYVIRQQGTVFMEPLR